jgi:excisionase family DNA binding protein
MRVAPITANDVARICKVDLKTIHNWCAKGKIPHTKTEGRHLRFRRLDVIDFLRKYEYPVPESLGSARPAVCIVDRDTGVHASARRALARRFDVTSFVDPIDALVQLASIDPEIVVFDEMPGIDAERWIERLGALEATRHVRVVVFGARAERKDALIEAGARAFVPKGDFAALRDTLEAIAHG